MIVQRNVAATTWQRVLNSLHKQRAYTVIFNRSGTDVWYADEDGGTHIIIHNDASFMTPERDFWLYNPSAAAIDVQLIYTDERGLFFLTQSKHEFYNDITLHDGVYLRVRPPDDDVLNEGHMYIDVSDDLRIGISAGDLIRFYIGANLEFWIAPNGIWTKEIAPVDDDTWNIGGPTAYRYKQLFLTQGLHQENTGTATILATTVAIVVTLPTEMDDANYTVQATWAGDYATLGDLKVHTLTTTTFVIETLAVDAVNDRNVFWTVIDH